MWLFPQPGQFHQIDQIRSDQKEMMCRFKKHKHEHKYFVPVLLCFNQILSKCLTHYLESKRLFSPFSDEYRRLCIEGLPVVPGFPGTFPGIPGFGPNGVGPGISSPGGFGPNGANGQGGIPGLPGMGPGSSSIGK